MVTAVAVLVWILSIVSIKCCKKSIEHHVKVFFVVIDPKEAYDQFRIRRELGGVIVAIVGSEVGVEWLSIVVVLVSVISARLVRLLLVLDAARRSATCAVIASNAGGLEGIVAPELALVRLSRLINSSNTCASVQGVFDVHRMWSTSGVAAVSFQFPFGDRVTFATVARQDRTGVCVFVCVCVCECVRILCLLLFFSCRASYIFLHFCFPGVAVAIPGLSLVL